MTRATPEAARPRWPLILAILAPPVLAGAILVPLLWSNEPASENLWVGATPYGPISTAPPAAVQVAHHALHDIGAECIKPTPDLQTITADVDSIISFAKRYPVGRFPIDDETATASSLLLVTREAVNDCAPAEAERLDAARRDL
jgi:hypothetical protein